MRYHHIGIAVENIKKEITFYETLGAQTMSPEIVDDVQKVRLQLLRMGGQMIELVSPVDSKTKSPIDNYLEKRIRMYHICYEVSDLIESITKFRKSGCLLIMEPTPAVLFNMRQISFVYTPNGDLIELLESDRDK